ncbi:MAG: type II CRISPR-associated endonuclease Cas1 [Firmicutes bacterium HGW-Firmicutes-8]|nr:MAG: type II CRISPR-associated endonuclease Cas1 [Firmicutes bacterium HGW-Firmicutes-8]
MPYRHVLISNQSMISVRNQQLVIKQDEEYTIPLSDISTIMLENHRCCVSAACLASLADYGISLFTCNDKHLPNGVLTPFNSHSRQLKALENQLAIAKPTKKRIWQAIIRQKITNQAQCLEQMGKPNANKLKHLAEKVESGDKTNLEGVAAQVYFTSLFGSRFSRRTETPINAGLNYGYALFRATIARTLTIHGLLPSLGIFHHSELNNFNLADDLLEPFRSVVDRWVCSNISANEEKLTPSLKKSLYSLFYERLGINQGVSTVTTAIELCVSSFVNAIDNKEHQSLKLPSLLPRGEDGD